MTTAVLTLLLSENTPIAFAGLMLLVPVVVALLFPVFFLSLPKSSWKAKLLAYALAFVPHWLGGGLSREFGWPAALLIYLPLGLVFVNLVRSASSPPNNQEDGEK